jgi:hypothetical protein
LLRNRVSWLRREAAELFRDDEEQMMEFVVEHDLGLTRAVLLKNQGKYGEAIRQYFDEGQETDGLDLTLEYIGDATRDTETFNALVRRFLWRHLSFGCRGWPESAEAPAGKIQTLLCTMPRAGLHERDQKMVSGSLFVPTSPLTSAVKIYIFKLIFEEEWSTSTQKILSHFVLRCNSLDEAPAVKLLGLDYFFDDMPSALDVSSQSGLVSSLQLFYEYSLLIKDVGLDKAPWDSPWIPTLFQFEKDGECIRILPGTFLHEHILTNEQSQSSEGPEHPALAVSLSREEFATKFSRLLSERLDSRIRDKDRLVSRLSLFDPCIQFTLYGTCRGDHPSRLCHQLDEGWFNRRARFQLQHIMILDNLYSFGLAEFPSRIRSQR